MQKYGALSEIKLTDNDLLTYHIETRHIINFFVKLIVKNKILKVILIKVKQIQSISYNLVADT